MTIVYIDTINQYAVSRDLLSPKFAKKYPEVIKNGIPFAIIPAHVAADYLEEWQEPNLMDNYKWSGRLTPYPHQMYTARFICKHGSLHIHSAMGTGKSLSALWALDQMMNEKLIGKVLIVSTKNGLFNTWEKEIGTHFIHRTYNIVTGAAKKRKQLVNEDIDFTVINHDGLTQLIKTDDMPSWYDYIVYDEATKIKTPSTDRYKKLALYYKKLKEELGTKIILMSGTPIAQSPLDAYTQCKLVDPTTVPKNFTIWKDMMLYKVREYVYVPRKEAPEICYRAMTPSIRFELDDCVSLPPLSYVQIKCEKTPEQAKMFRSMVNDFLAVSNEDEVYAVNAAAKYTKMLQILGGAVYTEDHKIIEVDTTPRIEALCELIDEVYPNPIVVVCNYRHILALVEKELNKHYKNIAVVNGDTSSTQLGAIINNFDRGQISILLSTPEPIAHSIDLTRSSTLIMYQPFPKNELNLQIVDRIRRLSSVTRGHKKLVIYQMYNDETEFLIYEKLRDKTITQNKLFSLIREELKNVYAI